MILLAASAPNSLEYEVYRNATVKGFELPLETSGKLLRRALKHHFGNPREVDRPAFKEPFRHAAKHGLVTVEETERCFVYWANRNDTAHDYGIGFAEDTLALLPGLLADVNALEGMLSRAEY